MSAVAGLAEKAMGGSAPMVKVAVARLNASEAMTVNR